jgi:uncharacterized protein YoxC
MTNCQKVISMKGTTNCQKRLQANFLTVLFASISLIVGFVFSGDAIAQTSPIPVVSAPLAALTVNSQSAPPAQKAAQVVDQSSRSLQAFVKQTQLSYDQAIKDTNQAINDLPQKIESAANATSISVRDQINKELEARKDVLDDTADAIDDLAEKLKKIGKSGLAQGAASAKSPHQVLDNTSDVIEVLADDIEDAEEDTSALLRARVAQHIKDVNQALEEANQTIKALAQNAA